MAFVAHPGSVRVHLRGLPGKAALSLFGISRSPDRTQGLFLGALSQGKKHKGDGAQANGPAHSDVIHGEDGSVFVKLAVGDGPAVEEVEADEPVFFARPNAAAAFDVLKVIFVQPDSRLPGSVEGRDRVPLEVIDLNEQVVVRHVLRQPVSDLHLNRVGSDHHLQSLPSVGFGWIRTALFSQDQHSPVSSWKHTQTR